MLTELFMCKPTSVVIKRAASEQHWQQMPTLADTKRSMCLGSQQTAEMNTSHFATLIIAEEKTP